ncbi:MAG: hypothetical protein HW397_101 [Dehalococcoidia bacterium]|nr:hypothetical protein [Dehalococcoidia bacterium]
MIYELRNYEAMPGKLAKLNERFANVTVKLFDKYGLKVIGFWTEEIGTSNTLVYMLAFEDMGQREKAWAAFRADPVRAQAFAESEKEGPLVARVTNKILRPTNYSPMK